LREELPSKRPGVDFQRKKGETLREEHGSLIAENGTYGNEGI
jgi:hypothetical protein